MAQHTLSIRTLTTRKLTRLAAAALTAFILSACGGGGDGGPPALTVDADGNSSFSATALGTSLAALPNESLNAAELASLAHMREEEKLAGDVYTQLNTAWGGSTRVFGNIANSEATHTEAVRQLLVRYQLSDPAAALAAGVYANASLQALYTQLVNTGSTSLVAALTVGVTVEDLDIADLTTDLASVDNQDIRLVYDNLLKGSRNHMRSFYKTLVLQGGSYTPQYLSQATFDAIVNSAIER